MRSLLIAVALVGCSAKTPPTPPPPPAEVAVTPAPAPPPPVVEPTEPAEPEREEPKDLPCEPRMESWPAGHHDRYVFQGTSEAQLGGKAVTIDKTGAVIKKNPYR